MNLSTVLLPVLVSLALAAPATAGTLAFTATSQGWVSVQNDVGTQGNYVVGNCGAADCGVGEYRNFFGFTVSAIPGTITSAELSLNTFGVTLLQSSNLTYQLASLSGSFGFADVGTGTAYGSRSYSASDAIETRSISLNQAARNAIAAAAGGTFLMGGRVVSATNFGESELDELIFAASENGQPQLIVNYSEGGAPAETPEPASALLAAAGMLGLGAARRYFSNSWSR